MNSFIDFKTQLKNCRLCREIFLHEPRPLVFGNEGAKIMIIGQAPSRKGMESGIPFNDATGEKLRSWLGVDRETFYNEDNFYITAQGHCFPGKAKSGGGDLLPPKICAQTWLNREVLVVQCELYIVVGRLSAEYFFPKQKFFDLVFSERTINGKKALIIPHPSPLNRKWLKDNPQFELEKLNKIKELVTGLLI